MAVRLIAPDEAYFDDYLTALQELKNTNSSPVHFQKLIDNFPAFVFEARRSELSNKDKQTYWLVDGTNYIGTVQIRNPASARYPNIASHIYYEIRPSKRRQGYGSKAFGLGIEKLRRSGLNRILISCDATNIPSRRIIEAAGARLVRDEQVPDRSEPVLMYEFVITESDDVPNARH